ncbi:unnamed protein product [Blepharisma stoltei]|uniref:FYVE-type domain-containing protein n=1 Tax=Blepharisma stoltei TaxID=1481888 RepID=A0AAU9ILQ5_9CILI|nr:unnamed protein product [Blepharisma stoltei]
MEETKIQALTPSSPSFKNIFSKKPPRPSNLITHCHICHLQFSAIHKGYECSVCKKGICKEHILVRTAMTLLPVCDDCERGRIKKEIARELAPQYKSLKGDMNWMLKEKEKIKAEITGKTEIISRLEIQTKNNEKTYAQRLENIEKKIEEENQREKTVQNVVESLKNALNESKSSEEQMKKKKEDKEEEIKAEVEEIKELKRSEEDVLYKIDEINKEMRKMIPAGKLKSISCRKCYGVLKVNFKERLREALRNEGRESLFASLMSRASVKSTNDLVKPTMEPMTRQYCQQCMLL